MSIGDGGENVKEFIPSLVCSIFSKRIYFIMSLTGMWCVRFDGY